MSATLLGACTTSSVVPVTRTPDPSLLKACVDPVLSDPDTATDNDFAADMTALAQAYVACKARHNALVQFEQAGNAHR